MSRLAMPVQRVTAGAGAHPRCKLIGRFAVMQPRPDVAQVFGDPPPSRAVAGTLAGESMGNLVQQDLMDVIVVISCGEVPGHRDAVSGEIAQACAALGIVEPERPQRWVEMQPDQRIGPQPNLYQI